MPQHLSPLLALCLAASCLVADAAAQSPPRRPEQARPMPKPPAPSEVPLVAARRVSAEVFDTLARQRVPAQRPPREGRAPRGGASTAPAVGGAVGGAVLSNPVPAGTPRVLARRPSGDVAALGGLLELRGESLGAANVAVRLAGQGLQVLERHPTLLLCALPAAGSAPVTGKLELSTGLSTVSGWTTLHPAFRLVLESDLTPRAEITSISDGPVAPDGRPYARTRYTTEVTFHEVPGNVVEEFECRAFVPQIFQKDLVVSQEFGFNSFKVSIPEAELAGGVRGNVESKFRTSRVGVPGSARSFPRVLASIEYAERAQYKIDETFVLRDLLGFTSREFFGLTQGTSQGLAGPIAVGMLDLQGDLAFRVASAPPSAYAVWVSSLVPLRNGWCVDQAVWEEAIVHPPGVDPLAQVLRQHSGDGFVFDIGQKYVGWKTLAPGTGADESPMVRFARHHTAADGVQTANPSPYDTQNRRFVRPQRVALRANPSPTNNHRATARLTSLTLSGPQGADWRSAFEPGVPVEKGRWLVDTMTSSQ